MTLHAPTSKSRASLLAALAAALLASAIGWPALAAKHHVIGPGGERALLDRLAPGGAALAGGWVVTEARIDKDRVGLVVARDGVDARLTLSHPEDAPPEAKRVGQVAVSPVGDAVPLELIEAVAARLASGVSVQWIEVDDGAELGNEARPAAPAPAQDAPGQLADYDMAEPVQELVRRVDHLIARGDTEMAASAVRATADEVASTAISKAVLAELAAATGDPERALALARTVSAEAALPLVRAVLQPSSTAAELLGDRQGGDACAAASLAAHLVRLGRSHQVPAFLATVLERDPACTAARVALAAHHIEQQEGAPALALLAALGAEEATDDAEIPRLRASALRLVGRLDEAIDEMERVVRGPARSAGDMGLLLGMYLREKELAKRIDLWRAEAKEHPDDVVAPFMVGVLLHYGNDFEESNRWLQPLNGRLEGEPRLFVYQAMNAFNLGDAATARRLLDEGAALAVVDPDIYYCRAEITRDTERELARADLKRYLALTEGTPHANAKKQARVRDMLAHLEACIADGTPKCGGPWEHPRRRYGELMDTVVWPLLATLVLGLIGVIWWRRRKR